MLILDRWTKYIQIYIILSPRLKSTSFCMFKLFSFFNSLQQTIELDTLSLLGIGQH